MRGGQPRAWGRADRMLYKMASTHSGYTKMHTFSILQRRLLSSRNTLLHKMLQKPKVLRLGAWGEAKAAWAELGEIVEIVDCESKTRDEFFADLKTKYNDITSIVRTFFSVNNTGRFDAELAAHLPETVKSVLHNGAGYDQIDVQPFTDKGIQVSNITTPVEAPTALTAVYLTLAALRNFQQGHELLTEGKWSSGGKCAGANLGLDPEGLTVGIIGMGGIGRAIRDRLVPFGFGKVVYYNRSRLSSELENGAEYVTFDDLVAKSDVIMLSVPLNAKTHHLINADVLAKTKKGVVIVNTARGAVIDEKALTDALKSGHIGAFGSDVFEHEPEVAPELYNMLNVVSLPHMGTHTKQALVNMEAFVVENVKTYLTTGKMLTNVPEQASVDFKHTPVI